MTPPELDSSLIDSTMRIELPLRPAVALLGSHFSAFALSFALASYYPDRNLWHYVCLLMVVGLPISLGYAFRKDSGDTGMATETAVGSEK